MSTNYSTPTQRLRGQEWIAWFGRAFAVFTLPERAELLRRAGVRNPGLVGTGWRTLRFGGTGSVSENDRRSLVALAVLVAREALGIQAPGSIDDLGELFGLQGAVGKRAVYAP